MFRVIAPRPQVQSHLITYFYRVLSCTYPRYYIKYRMCARRPFDMFVNFYFLFYFFILSSQLRIRRCVWNRNEKKTASGHNTYPVLTDNVQSDNVFHAINLRTKKITFTFWSAALFSNKKGFRITTLSM